MKTVDKERPGVLFKFSVRLSMTILLYTYAFYWQ